MFCTSEVFSNLKSAKGQSAAAFLTVFDVPLRLCGRNLLPTQFDHGGSYSSRVTWPVQTGRRGRGTLDQVEVHPWQVGTKAGRHLRLRTQMCQLQAPTAEWGSCKPRFNSSERKTDAELDLSAWRRRFRDRAELRRIHEAVRRAQVRMI